jgi:hypothetical protein
MKILAKIAKLSLPSIASVLFVQLCVAQTPPNAPPGSTGMCNDGTYSSSASKKGACRGHKGVKLWYAVAGSEKSTPTSTSAPMSPPAPAPAGATGQCNDGTYSTNATRKGACRGHKGVKQWFAAAPDSEPATKSATSEPSAPARAPASVPASTPAQVKDASPAPGGGSGQVWVNTSTNVYHCEGTRYYGKTKAGAYMSEADAKAKGARPDHGKACSAQ